MANFPSECIIIGGGKSILPYISLLQPLLATKFTIACNYAYKTFPSTFLAFSDRNFYVPLYAKKNPDKNPDIYEELKKLPLIIGIDHNGISEFKMDNTILLNNKYRSALTGIFALKLAMEIMQKGTIYLCYSEDTEIFTNQGWKYFKDLNKTELILTRKSNGKTEWSPILNYYEYSYNGIMKHIKSKGIDLLVTPEHSQCLINKNNKNYIFKPINKLTTNGNFKIPKWFDWIGKKESFFVLPGYSITYKQNKSLRTKNINNIKLKMNDWLAFLGIYISEGCCLLRKNRSSCELIIYQTHNQESDKFIESILKKLPFNYSYHKRGWVIYDKRLVNYLNQLGTSKTKYIPTEFKNLPKKQLLILLNSLMFGDGHYNHKQKTNYYFTISKRLADDVQEIAYKCGFIAGLYRRKGRICKISSNPKIGQTSYTVYFRKKSKQGNLNNIIAGNLVFKNKIKDIDYNGKIYDVTVNNHTLWIRRNGICVWSGNCGFDWNRRIGLPERDPNYNPYTSENIHFYNDIKHRGVGYVGYYENHNPDREFNQFIKKDIKIYNVSLESNINSFEKISYEQFYKLLSNKEENQEELRHIIRTKLSYNKN